MARPVGLSQAIRTASCAQHKRGHGCGTHPTNFLLRSFRARLRRCRGLMVSTRFAQRSRADTAALDAFRDWLAADLGARPLSHALVISDLGVDAGPSLGAGKSVTMLRPSAPDAGDQVLASGLAGGSFDAVYLHRMIHVEVPAPWLGTLRRLLRCGGTILAAADAADFTFAPLPKGGDALLLGRALRAARFHRTELVCRGPRLVIVAACRDDPDSPDPAS
jgi:hypothetical protein